MKCAIVCGASFACGALGAIQLVVGAGCLDALMVLDLAGYPTTWQETTSPGIFPKLLAQWVVPCLDPQARWGPCLGSTQFSIKVGRRALLQVSWKVPVTFWQETLHEPRQNVEIDIRREHIA